MLNQNNTFKMISHGLIRPQNLEVNLTLDLNINYIFHNFIQAAKDKHMLSREVKFNKCKYKKNGYLMELLNQYSLEITFNNLKKMYL